MKLPSVPSLIRSLPDEWSESFADFLQRAGASMYSWGAYSQDGTAQAMADRLDKKASDPTDTPDLNTSRGSGFSGGMTADQIFRSMDDPYSGYFLDTNRALSRREVYSLCHQMDLESPEISRGLDAIKGNACTSEDGSDTTFEWGAKSDVAKQVMDGLNERTLLPEKGPGHIRSDVKFGDLFAEKVADQSGLIWDINSLPQSTVCRVEDCGRLEGFYQMDNLGGVRAEWTPQWIMHLRHNPEDGALYGRSQMLSARKPFIQLSYLEDHTVIMVLDRAEQKLVHVIAVREGDDGDEDVTSYAKRNILKRTYDSVRGKLSSRYKPKGRSDYIVTRQIGDKHKIYPETDIHALEEQTNYDKVIKVDEHFQRKILICMGVPPAYLGIEAHVNAKATLMHEEIEFGRFIRQIQANVAKAYKRQIYGFQFQLLGMDVPEDEYWVQFPPPARVDERIKAEVVKLQAEAAAELGKVYPIPLDVVMQRFFGWSEDEAVHVAYSSGVANSSTEGLGESKRSELFDRIREQLHGGDERSRVVLRDTIVALAEAAHYFSDFLPEAA